MLRRHATPTVFSLYMVDVLCCALGCVVLLWQMNLFDAQEQTTAAVEANKSLKEAHLSLNSINSEVDSLRLALDASNKNLDSSKKRVVQVTLELDDTRKERDKAEQLSLVVKKNYDATRQELDQARTVLAGLQIELKDWQKKNDSTTTDLAQKAKENAELLKKMQGADARIVVLDKENAELLKKMQGADARIVVLEKDLAEKLQKSLAAGKTLEELTQRIEQAETRKGELQKTLGEVQRSVKDFQAKLGAAELRARLLEDDLSKGKKTLAISEDKLRELVLANDILNKKFTLSAKELEEAKKTLATAKGDSLALLNQARLARLAAENRFAGIALTGKKVVFIVDMSGSMELWDENTPDPDKWPWVCDTVGKIMSSLPELKQFQVFVFSDKARYVLPGTRGKWLNFDPKASTRDTVAALKAVKPKGETNLHVVFDEAFTFRDQGLDTIYVFSDGLPNAGEGLPFNAASLTEQQKGEILGKHLRSRLKNVWNRPIPGQQRVRINTIGFFFESPDVGAFLWALARENDGNFVGMNRP